MRKLFLGVARLQNEIGTKSFFESGNFFPSVGCFDGRNRAIVIAESLARVIAAIRITSVRRQSYLPLETQNFVLVDPAFLVLRFESRDWCSLV